VRIWAILGTHRGDNNQVLALAEALGLPFERKQLSYNRLRHFQPRLLGATLRSLRQESREAIAGDAPDLTISTGHRSVPVVQALRRRSAGRLCSIHVGYPRISPDHFELVVATPEYPIPDHPNLMRIPFALTPRRTDPLPDRKFLEAYPAPRRILILGGPTLYWRLKPSDVAQRLERLFKAAQHEGGSVVVVGSPRTPRNVLASVKALIAKARVPTTLVPMEGPPSYGSLLASADSLFVTADSVAMVSDAIATGKPVGVIPVRPTVGGRLAMSLLDRLRSGHRIPPRDLRYFWETLENDGLVGTIDAPRSGGASNVNRTVASRVKALLSGGSGASR
jgi:mitochondrial fission protein ELM1